MALVTLNAPEFSGVSIDPDYISEDTLKQIMDDAPAPRSADSETPFAALLETGADRETAIAAVRDAVVNGGLLEDEFSALMGESDTSVDPAALFDEIADDYRTLPTIEDATAKFDAENAGLSDAFVLVTNGDMVELLIDGEVRLEMPAMMAKKKKLDKMVALIRLCLDVIALAFALLDIPIAKNKKWAKDLAESLGNVKKWLDDAEAFFSKFEEAYKIYKSALGDKLAGDARGASKAEAFAQAAKAFASGLLATLKWLANKGWALLKALIKMIFSNWRAIARALVDIAIAALEWAGAGASKVAKAVVKAISCALDVLDDVDAWRAA
ncbi:hypothetical protein BXY66_4065 [Shimia isoporae]|uniref:Uncharacterized protein n=1 Tax=Shimia isoporae TaxID=647720 RepID=A0A4R1N202_9RHOB|nr:hypothetical protein [Shimia isoporae]TCK99000.1 hypothetical protein BXY66_4065 [Shimia isoporae]